ncbi:hypothetical protein IU485_27905 [Nocardia cyriacigeorgica]|uniref:hypothetical protein n=1 Tax=Nocardia cyriacigeorgica TaxID=135487 RepID=UPI001892E554|nr:hypothetical protein [Nocardia cyriacigeorgica]MBF6085203.1 hypothetical protein [Nocardia cyriacigeorgica]
MPVTIDKSLVGSVFADVVRMRKNTGELRADTRYVLDYSSLRVVSVRGGRRFVEDCGFPELGPTMTDAYHVLRNVQFGLKLRTAERWSGKSMRVVSRRVPLRVGV